MSQLNTPLYNLVKTGNYMYNLHIKGDNRKPLYLSLLKTKQLTNIFYNSEENSICFTAGKIETLDSNNYWEGRFQYCIAQDQELPGHQCNNAIL